MSNGRYAQWCDKHLSVKSRHGSEYLCLCVFHDNKSTPSLCINVNKGLFVCYSCNAKGHVNRIAQKLGVGVAPVFDGDDVMAKLREKTGTNQQAKKIKEYPENYLDRFDWRRPHPYWSERGVARTVARDYKLGYAQDLDAVTVPIRNVNGGLMGVIYRYLGPTERSKYRYPSGFKISWHLFNACRYMQKDYETPENLVITEGSIDAILMDQEGYDSVSILGSILHPHQLTIINQLAPDKITLMLDNDSTGRHASMVIAAQLMKAGHIVYVARTLRGKKDAGNLTPNERHHVIDTATSYIRLRSAV